VNRYEKEIKAIDEAMLSHVNAYKEIFDREEKEDRKLTEDERETIQTHLKAIEVLKTEKQDAEAGLKTVQEVEDLGRKLGPSVSSIKSVQVGDEPLDRVMKTFEKSLGEQFVESPGYKNAQNLYKESGRLPSGFSTGQVSLEAKGTLLEGAGGGGGGLAATVPQVVPGVVDRLFQGLTVADLFMSGQASTNSIRYVVEGTATSGAAGVAEAGLKPESTLGLTTTDEPIKKIATILPVSDEMLEDAPQIQAYINGRLSLFVRIEEERQLVRGTSGGNEVQGLLTGRGVPVYAGGTAVGNRAVQLFKAMNGMRGSAFLEPDWVIMNPADWEAVRLLTDSAGQFMGGGPFMGQYGNNGMISASGQASGAADSIWNKPTYVTAAVGAGTAIVGSRAAAQVWRRGGLSVEATNSHADYFQRNLVAIRAEERLGLAVYRPTGFVEVRLA
jgi:HK97 family phage major capsid protein